MATEPSWAGFRRMERVKPKVEARATSGREWSPWRLWIRQADLDGRQWEFRRVTNRVYFWVGALTIYVLKVVQWSRWSIATASVSLAAVMIVAQRIGLHRLRDRDREAADGCSHAPMPSPTPPGGDR
jgi:hypothetical protein